MNEESIGKLILNLRTKNNISQEQLTRGLCSDATLSRIEIGERIPDKFLLDALLQRLGKSPDKIETILCESDFNLLKRRQEIENDLLIKNYNEASSKLENYIKQKDAKSRIHSQYIYRIKAILADERDHNIAAAINYIKQAIEYTIPEFDIEKILQYYLSLDELHIILMQALYESKRKVTDETQQILNHLMNYLDKKYTDEEEKVKIYPQIVYLMAKQLVLENNYIKMVELCEKAINLLISNGSIYYLAELMQLSMVAYENTNNESAYKHMEKKLDCIVSIYNEYHIPYLEGRFSTPHENINGGVYLINEVVKYSRIASGISQENLSEGICTPETLSRVENGKRTPSSQNFRSLMQKLGRKRDIYSTILSVDEFEILEKRREISKCLSKRQYEEAQFIFDSLKLTININTKKNKQYIETLDTLLKYKSQKIGEQEAIFCYEKTLSYTLENIDNGPPLIIPLTSEEAHIYNLIAIANYRMGRKEEAVRILKSVLENHEISKINTKYNFITIIPFIYNLSKYLEEMNCLEEALEYCDYGINILLLNKKGNTLADFLINKAYTYERIDNKNKNSDHMEISKNYYLQAFYCSDIMNDINNKKLVKEYCKEHYDKTMLCN